MFSANIKYVTPAQALHLLGSIHFHWMKDRFYYKDKINDIMIRLYHWGKLHLQIRKWIEPWAKRQ